MATNTAHQTTGSISPNQHVSAGWTTLFCLLAGMICISIWLRHTACSKSTSSTANDDLDPLPFMRKGVHLEEITLNKAEADTDIDIIAIHGLDTTSRDTWIWKDPQDLKNKRKWVNWLRPGMLPASVDRVRIFTCDWPADLLVPSNLVQKTIEEYALLLLDGIENALFVGSVRQQDRPIVFIASCLGGLILIRALVHANDKRSSYYSLRRATRGIVFLATPFRGTSFQDVAAWAETGLKAKASIQGREVSRLLDSVKESTFQLEESVSKFTRLCQDMDNPCEVFSFYELGKTSLPHKAFPWLPSWFSQKKQLIDRSSATLDIISDPIALHRPHSLMNKFRDFQCPDYEKVAGKIRWMIGRIREGTPLEQADTWIRDKHYTADRLRIERLSGESLSMGQCYINLAIVEQSGQDAGHSKKGGTAPSPFSILARQKVEAPDKTMQVELAALFNERNGSDGRPILPRRILIRGRAGVGKTTLCKKIVYEFTKGSLGKWNELFDRVLWVPLRNLKLPERCSMPKYTFEDLFSHEFSLPANGQNLAGALYRTLNSKNSKTLFLLDGLDEVSQELTGDGSMPRFFAELLRQPNVIITSRPSANAPTNLHLELETIGFSPNQVNKYIKKSFTNSQTGETDQTKVHNVQSFLQERWLIQGLVRIPIQLDALCYMWDELKPDDIPNTMTGMYEEIELNLWKRKDVFRLEKQHDNKKLHEGYLQTVGRRKIERLVEDEMAFIESLAFTGLHNDILDFTPAHLDSISDLFTPSLLPDKVLPSLSFLRTSDPLSGYNNRNYHFIHLTFQEYFAARYFVRQWKVQEGQLWFLTLRSKAKEISTSRPTEFLQRHKYTARYDIFWRFVAGLLDGAGQAPEFISTIEEEPLDLLGLTHQRLVMHCLSEISSKLLGREDLERRLALWLLFECKFRGSARLASESEFPELALKTSLLTESNYAQRTILQSLANRASIPQSIIESVAARLDSEDDTIRTVAVGALAGQEALSITVLTAVVARLDDGDWHVRSAAIDALRRREMLPDEVLKAVAARLDSKLSYVRIAAIETLSRLAVLSDKLLTTVAARCDDQDWSVRRAAVKALRGRAVLPDEVLMDVTSRLDDGDAVKRATAVEALGGRAVIPDEVLIAIAARFDDMDSDVRRAAVRALCGRPTLPCEISTAIAALLNHKVGELWRAAAVGAQGGRAALPDEVFIAMLARLDDKDLYMRTAAIETLAEREALSDKVLMAIVARLSDKDWHVQNVAVQVLSRQAALPHKLLIAMAAWLDNGVSNVRSAAINSLREQLALPNEVLIAVVARLDDDNSYTRRTAVDTLGRQAKLSNEMLMAMAARLYDEDWNVRSATIRALSGRVALPNEVLTAIRTRLNDENYYVRRATVDAVGGCAALADEVVTAVAARLDDEDWDVRRAAVEALGGRPLLPDRVLTAMAARLDDQDWRVRNMAVKTLMRNRENFSHTIHTKPLIVSFFKASFERSFIEQLSWYVETDSHCINIPAGVWEISINAPKDDVMEWIYEVRHTDCPSTGGVAIRPTTSPANEQPSNSDLEVKNGPTIV